jgi:hypothetical protein
VRVRTDSNVRWEGIETLRQIRKAT